MIYDKLKNYKKYLSIHPRFKAAFEYLTTSDFSKIEAGKYIIDGENIFALVQQYSPKKEEDCNLEGHEKYIDIQYMYSGVEQMGFCTLFNQIPIEGKYVNDLAFFNDDYSLIKVVENIFVIFFPDDLHKPGIRANEDSIVKKIVVKVKIT